MSQMLSTSALIRAFSVTPRKSRGQNFLKDAKTAEMLVARAGISAEDAVLEIGAGMGAMTFPLAAAASHVFAVESDERVAEVLSSQMTPESAKKISLILSDILKVSLSELREKAGRPLTVFGNLPYYLSSQVLIKLILERQHVGRAFLLFQKELADRILAPSGNRDYGRISVAAQYASKIRPVATLCPEQFFPKPKIFSTLLQFDFREAPIAPAMDETIFFQVVAGAFGKRRKMLKNALLQFSLSLGLEGPGPALALAGIDPGLRAERLSPREFVLLADAFSKLSEHLPQEPPGD